MYLRFSHKACVHNMKESVTMCLGLCALCVWWPYAHGCSYQSYLPSHTFSPSQYWSNSKSSYRFLVWTTVGLLIHSLVISRLDYCNSLLYGVPGYKLKYLQRMQNIAARIVSRCPYRDHLTQVLESLHYLPVEYRILFELLLLTYKCLKWLTPGYPSSLVVPRKRRYEPRPQHRGQLQVPEVRLKSYGERSFSFSAPAEWNRLPIDVKSALTLESFKVKLKTDLFKICYKWKLTHYFCFLHALYMSFNITMMWTVIYIIDMYF